jgi:Tfp pilus assembly protein PilF
LKYHVPGLALATVLFALLAGCSAAPVAGIGDRISTLVHGKGTPALSAGVKSFESGRYAEATKNLQHALDLGLSFADDQAKAHKYLAFIHCVSNRLQLCRDQFGKALDAAPGMELEPAETGHPVWGPAFRSVKARR